MVTAPVDQLLHGGLAFDGQAPVPARKARPRTLAVHGERRPSPNWSFPVAAAGEKSLQRAVLLIHKVRHIDSIAANPQTVAACIGNGRALGGHEPRGHG